MSLYMLDGHAGAYKPSSPFELRHASTHRPLLVVVPERRLLAIHGAGPRRAADFLLATSLLRTVGEVIRAMVLRDRRVEPVRSVLEVTWPTQPGLTVDEIVDVLSHTPRWRQMLELPHNATDAVAVAAIEEAQEKGSRDVPLVRPIQLIEGPAVQILHLGSDDEMSTIRKLYASIAETGFRASGPLHELVIADPNAVGQARARSILRVPVAYE